MSYRVGGLFRKQAESELDIWFSVVGHVFSPGWIKLSVLNAKELCNWIWFDYDMVITCMVQWYAIYCFTFNFKVLLVYGWLERQKDGLRLKCHLRNLNWPLAEAGLFWVGQLGWDVAILGPSILIPTLLPPKDNMFPSKSPPQICPIEFCLI